MQHPLLARLRPDVCVTCARPIAAHGRATMDDVIQTAGASWDHPVTLTIGHPYPMTYRAPVSPDVIGQYRGHTPVPPRGAIPTCGTHPDGCRSVKHDPDYTRR